MAAFSRLRRHGENGPGRTPVLPLPPLALVQLCVWFGSGYCHSGRAKDTTERGCAESRSATYIQLGAKPTALE